ncbi:MAG TPA: ATP-binding cassette domain-containing protein [Propionibacteriaceae bacterium]|nr:ATP-binding cassette domain-containing protein [Propionibacteriaceae bacterium]
MKVFPGKVSALVGDNGAGKSTLIKGLSGAQPYDSGDLSFEGSPVTLAHPKDAPTTASRLFTRTSHCARTSTSCRTCSWGVRRFTSACSTSRRWRSTPRQRSRGCRSGP